jgi:hypothetical protein
MPVADDGQVQVRRDQVDAHHERQQRADRDCCEREQQVLCADGAMVGRKPAQWLARSRG